MPLISIIVPCYQQSEYLDECLQSVFVQTEVNWECIIVNDGSLDETDVVAENWLKRDVRFKYLKKENGGLSSARNAGIRIALGTFILPLDADDKISENYLRVCSELLLANSDAKVAYGQGIKFGIINGIWPLSKFSLENLKLGNMIFCSAIYRKEDWERVGGYDESMRSGFEDWEFWIALLKEGGDALMDDRAFFYYRIKHNSLTMTLKADALKKIEIRRYIFHKHLDLYIGNDLYDFYINSISKANSNQSICSLFKVKIFRLLRRKK